MKGFVYLTREFRYALGRESIEAVGGVVENGEQALAAAKRELKEELGIEASDFLYLGYVDPVSSIIRSPVHLYLVRDLRFGEKRPDSHEEIETVKMPMEQAGKDGEQQRDHARRNLCIAFEVLVSTCDEDNRPN